MTTTTETPKPKRRPRRGPPGVKCSQCSKIAGAEDEGRVEGYSAEVSGDAEKATVNITAQLYLTTACCGVDFKLYDLEGEAEQDHSCAKMAERNAAADAWEAHADDCDRRCDAPVGEAAVVDPDCQEGVRLKNALDDLQEAIDSEGEEWEVDDDGEGNAEPYQRSQTTTTVRRKTKAGVKLITKPITNYRYAKRYRGFSTTVTIKHALCGETEEVEFGEGQIEEAAGSFQEV
jgi:hypothetical protein